MADEITIAMSAAVVNGNFSDSVKPGTITIDQAAIGASSGVRNIGTSAESVSTGDLTTEGYCYMRNLDATNFVKYGPDSTGQVDFGKLKAGEVAIFRLMPAIDFKITADTAACLVDIRIYED